MGNFFYNMYESCLSDGKYLVLLDALKFTLEVTFLATIIGIIGGTILTIMRLSSEFLKETRFKVLEKYNVFYWFATGYIGLMRGTPVLVQLLFISGVIFVGDLSDVPKLVVASIAFGLNSSAYVSEILRSGIQSLDKGQMEAGRALGLPYGKTMRVIVLPQAIKKTLPTLVSEFIVLLKETSIVGYIGGVDLFKYSQQVTARTYKPVYPLALIAIIYLILVGVFTALMRVVERRLGESD